MKYICRCGERSDNILCSEICVNEARQEALTRIEKSLLWLKEIQKAELDIRPSPESECEQIWRDSIYRIRRDLLELETLLEKQSPQSHATQELGSEDKGLEGQASGSKRAERPLS